MYGKHRNRPLRIEDGEVVGFRSGPTEVVVEEAMMQCVCRHHQPKT